MRIQNALCAAFAAALLLCLGAQAGETSKKPANYPVRPVQLMVSNAAGDGTDIMVRALIAEMDLGRPITVVNRGGASGTIGTAEGAKAAPNGYMITVGAPAPFYIRPHIDNLSYDIGDFRHIVQISPEEPLVLAVTPSSPYKSFKDIEAAWKRGEALKFSSANPGSVGHCAMMDLFKQMGVTGGVNVPAMGGGGAMNDLIDVGISESSTFSGNSPMLTSRFFPRFAACLLGLSSLACLAGSVVTLRAKRTAERPVEEAVADASPAAEDGTVWSEFRVLGLLGLFVLYGVLFHPLGYLYASIVVCTLTLVLLKCKNWKYYVISWAFAGLIFLVFTRLLYVPLP